MLRDHSNKWKQKYTSFWWKPLRTNHKWPHSSTLIVFLRENKLFQRGWGVLVTLVEIPRGWGVISSLQKWKILGGGGGGGPKWNSLCGGGLHIFWNYTFLEHIICFLYQVDLIKFLKYLFQCQTKQGLRWLNVTWMMQKHTSFWEPLFLNKWEVYHTHFKFYNKLWIQFC